MYCLKRGLFLIGSELVVGINCLFLLLCETKGCYILWLDCILDKKRTGMWKRGKGGKVTGMGVNCGLIDSEDCMKLLLIVLIVFRSTCIKTSEYVNNGVWK